MIGVVAFTMGHTDRVYGGPEEGGWYYNRFTPLRVLLVPAAKGERCERLLHRWQTLYNAGRRPLSSVLSSGRADFYHGIEPATPSQHYE
jgi:hypothetical protein